MRVARSRTGLVAALVVAATAAGCGGDDGASCPGDELGPLPLEVELTEAESVPELTPEIRGLAAGSDGELYFNLAASVYCIANDTAYRVITPETTPLPEGEEDSSYIDVGVDPDGTPMVVDWMNPGVYAIDDRDLTLVPGTDAEEIGGSRSIVVDGDGTIFMTGLNQSGTTDVYAVADGEARLFAGGGEDGIAGDGGPATESSLFEPEGLAVDADDNLLIADRNNQRIARVTPDGTIDTLIGGGTSFDDREADEALLGPNDVTVDPDGRVFVFGGSLLLEIDDGEATAVSADGASSCELVLDTDGETTCPIDQVALTNTARIEFASDGALWMNAQYQLLRMVDGQVEVVVELTPA